MTEQFGQSIEDVRRLAVLGQPISHSLSPVMHNAAFAALGLADEWVYEAIELSVEEFDDGTRDLARRGFVGANVTVPHKRAALSLADDATRRAREIGAANTLTFDAGSIRADNTDAPGLIAALREDPSDVRALVLGAGGSARAVVWALARAGAHVSVWNRTAENAEALADAFEVTTLRPDGPLPLSDYELIVHATAVGLGGPRASDLDQLHVVEADLDADHTVVDLVYGEESTSLLRAAEAAGATTVDGREILVRQGAESFRIWTGLEPPLDAMRTAVGG